jgi:uncharacterized protein YkwD
VPIWVLSPEKPVERVMQRKTIGIIAREPLRSGTTYTVKLSAQTGKTAWDQSWSFTTISATNRGDDSAATRALEQLNRYRKIAGLAPVTLDPALSKACLAHANYLVKNSNHPATQGMGMHKEDPSLPGYSAEGAKAGQVSVIMPGDPLKSVDGWMDTFFHRIPLLDPEIRTIGFGAAKGGRWGWFTVMDAQSGIGIPGPVCYPGDKQKDVPLFYADVHNPSAVPDDKPAGYPITVTFAHKVPVLDVKATLRDDKGKEVEVWLSTPEKPVEARLQRNTVCLLAKQPLQPKRTYTVTVSAQVATSPWARTWSFTTRASSGR